MSGHSRPKNRTEAAGPFHDFMRACCGRVETALDRRLPAADSPPVELHRAMRYAALAGGKYVRPMLVYATGSVFGADPVHLDGAACAVELIHAYSLVHDDLPAMDDDALRRGKPSCHVAFGEALAILAGDALQALAFQAIAADASVEPRRRVEMLELLAHASGSLGMAGGQAIDLMSVGKKLSLAGLEHMHGRKTGALIRASVLLGAIAAGNEDAAAAQRLDDFALLIGLSFQVHDDVLDVEGETATLGKTGGSDLQRGKPTYCSALGLDGAKAMAAELYDRAIAHLDAFGERADKLRALSRFIIDRDH